MLTGVILKPISYARAIDVIRKLSTGKFIETRRTAESLFDFLSSTRREQALKSTKICIDCGLCCYDFKFYTADAILFFLRKGNMNFLQNLQSKNHPKCKFLSSAGCNLPREDRPIICSTYLCDRFEGDVGEDFISLCKLARKVSFCLEQVYTKELFSVGINTYYSDLLEEFQQNLKKYKEK